MTTADIAATARARQFYYTPYRTGNLARSVGVIQTYFTESHYKMFDEVRDAPYGKALNEEPVMQMQIKRNGETKTITYVNKHYKWVDKYVEMEAYEIDKDLNTERG